jgi:2-isopropylmalate synthase
MSLELYDSTLRDGEQAAGASFNLKDRIAMFQLLDDFGFDYIELGWPVTSKEVFDSFAICQKLKRNSKIAAFGSTTKENPSEDKNLNSILQAKPDVACIFGKTSLEHVFHQLKATPEENLEFIRKSIEYLKANHLVVFYDAEHFFDGFLENKEYALQTLVTAIKAGAERIILCDTNGGLTPEQTKEITKETYEYLSKLFPEVKLGIHLHNDAGLAHANTLAALPWITQVQGTVNGMGERVGNLDFSSFLPSYNFQYQKEIKLDLKKLKRVHDEAYRLAGKEIPESKPFVGETAFAHKGGVHIDAIRKGGARYEKFSPEKIGNSRRIVLNTLGGSASVVDAASQFGYQLDKKNPEVKKSIEKLYNELKTLEEKGYRIGALPAEQGLLVLKYFGEYQEFFRINSWRIKTGMENGKEFSEVQLKGQINKNHFDQTKLIEGGPVDAVYKTLQEILSTEYPQIKNLKLEDFHVGIARRGGEESSVRTVIDFSNGETFRTVGVDANILCSALEAIQKGFQYYLNTVGGRFKKHTNHKVT